MPRPDRRAILCAGFAMAFLAPAGGARAADHPALTLVKSFYKPNFPDDKIPFSARLARLHRAAAARAKKDGGVVSGLDFSWVSNGQDAEDGWEKTAKFTVETAAADAAGVRVTFNNGTAQTLTYSLVRQGGKWKVDDIAYAGEDAARLSELFEKGARGE